ncbi:D-hexose-6-phosphate mutarotase [Aquabacterium sp. A7-Y]|uniref:D-hexose-6-phosphate mutarotase n=1 Tax=Aquabacterium sp. A7-Y TaxID=1349605 RepID=UPI00223DDA5A|nr:D-hexose-6-phosphate mutarotase [Aquabacterium sp. A7-Y]MCW7539399.1 D-hexose-6-phosphate mutarotase [Aquabacterium sp. A7-Y]
MSNISTPELVDLQGQPAVQLQARDGARVTVMLQGAQVVGWTPAGGSERLYVSEQAVYAEGQPVRGGVPVIFPQFEKRGPLQRHGFARNKRWQLLRAEVGRDDALAVLRLEDDAETRAVWPHAFALELTVAVGGSRLDLELEIEHRGGEGAAPFSFMAALHTYLRVREVEEARLKGLQGLRYEDSTRPGSEPQVEFSAALSISGETDRIYFGATRPLVLEEPHRGLVVETQQFPDVVVWNPWEEKCAALPDMPPLGFRRMLCVEAALIGEPVTLAPGEQWWGRQSLLAD